VEEMKNISYKTTGVCAREIHFTLDDNNCIHNLRFDGGCNGNLKAIGKLCEGQSADKIINLLKGNLCGSKATSCADQLAKALEKNV